MHELIQPSAKTSELVHDWLAAHGIEALVDLPGVGENWQVRLPGFKYAVPLSNHLSINIRQDQPTTVVQFELKPGIATFGGSHLNLYKPDCVSDDSLDILRNNATFAAEQAAL